MSSCVQQRSELRSGDPEARAAASVVWFGCHCGGLGGFLTWQPFGGALHRLDISSHYHLPVGVKAPQRQTKATPSWPAMQCQGEWLPSGQRPGHGGKDKEGQRKMKSPSPPIWSPTCLSVPLILPQPTHQYTFLFIHSFPVSTLCRYLTQSLPI